VGPGREPSEEEVVAVLNSRRWEFATAEDIRIAYDCGKEVSHLSSVTMCPDSGWAENGRVDYEMHRL
jgi:hypothetical protein